MGAARKHLILGRAALAFVDEQHSPAWAPAGVQGEREHPGRRECRIHFVSAVSGYQSSALEADTLVRERLGTFDPRGGPAGC
jgi:hypothetical protein